MWDICDTFHVARASCVRQRAMHVWSAHSCVLHAVTGGQLFWQQDGAPPHFYKPAREWLNVHFQDRWIGRSPSHRSHRLAGSKPRPDSLQFPSVEWHKSTIVYREQPSSIDELKFRIRAAFEEIIRWRSSECHCRVWSTGSIVSPKKRRSHRKRPVDFCLIFSSFVMLSFSLFSYITW